MLKNKSQPANLYFRVQSPFFIVANLIEAKDIIKEGGIFQTLEIQAVNSRGNVSSQSLGAVSSMSESELSVGGNISGGSKRAISRVFLKLNQIRLPRHII